MVLKFTAIQESTTFRCEFLLSVRVRLAWASGRGLVSHTRAFTRRVTTFRVDITFRRVHTFAGVVVDVASALA